jgi:hypothetical protein
MNLDQRHWNRRSPGVVDRVDDPAMLLAQRVGRFEEIAPWDSRRMAFLGLERLTRLMKMLQTSRTSVQTGHTLSRGLLAVSRRRTIAQASTNQHRHSPQQDRSPGARQLRRHGGDD